MARPAATAGPMRLVQCDGFVVYAGKDAKKSQEAAPRRPPAVARSSPRAVKPPATVSTSNGAARHSSTWSFALRSAVFAAILMGLFGAYSLGRYAATSGPRTGLVYTRPAAASGLAPKISSADTVTGRLPPNTYLR